MKYLHFRGLWRGAQFVLRGRGIKNNPDLLQNLGFDALMVNPQHQKRQIRCGGAERSRTANMAFMISETRPFKIPESVLVVIYTPQLDVLLIERAGPPGLWQSVTGAKDTPDEALRQTARREVWEETGIAAAPEQLQDWGLVNVYDIYPIWRHRYAPGVTRNTEHVWGLCVPQTCAVTLSPREHVAWQWLPHRAAADACFSASNAEAILLLPRLIV